MSREALMQAVERASTDAAFRSQLQRDPDAALAGYDLTPEERAALRADDSEQLAALGVDARVTKQSSPPLDNPPGPGAAFPTEPWY
ncbi:MAG TPA: Os1348 family NHLP clan protein [Chloroflexota bacterium]|nr:Os1348 family NHLP clan protein [Chloroflexota bacterium]